MDDIDLAWHDFWHHLWPGPQLLIRINGQPLIDQVRALELPWAERAGDPALAGAYDWLLSVDCDLHLLGSGLRRLLCCHCGLVGCWSLQVQVDVAADTVTWSGFVNPQSGLGHGPVWDLSALGPFVFDRRAYEDAVARIRGVIDRGYIRPVSVRPQKSVLWPRPPVVYPDGHIGKCLLEMTAPALGTL